MGGADSLGDWLSACIVKRCFIGLNYGGRFGSHRKVLLAVKMLIFVALQARSGNAVQG